MNSLLINLKLIIINTPLACYYYWYNVATITLRSHDSVLYVFCSWSNSQYVYWILLKMCRPIPYERGLIGHEPAFIPFQGFTNWVFLYVCHTSLFFYRSVTCDKSMKLFFSYQVLLQLPEMDQRCRFYIVIILNVMDRSILSDRKNVSLWSNL